MEPCGLWRVYQDQSRSFFPYLSRFFKISLDFSRRMADRDHHHAEDDRNQHARESIQGEFRLGPEAIAIVPDSPAISKSRRPVIVSKHAGRPGGGSSSVHPLLDLSGPRGPMQSVGNRLNILLRSRSPATAGRLFACNPAAGPTSRFLSLGSGPAALATSRPKPTRADRFLRLAGPARRGPGGREHAVCGDPRQGRLRIPSRAAYRGAGAGRPRPHMRTTLRPVL
jgi:hypothetical protein